MSCTSTVVLSFPLDEEDELPVDGTLTDSAGLGPGSEEEDTAESSPGKDPPPEEQEEVRPVTVYLCEVAKRLEGLQQRSECILQC